MRPPMIPPTAAAQGMKVAQPLVITIMPACRVELPVFSLHIQKKAKDRAHLRRASTILQWQMRKQLTAEGAVSSRAQVPDGVPGGELGDAQLDQDAGDGSKATAHRGGNYTA